MLLKLFHQKPLIYGQKPLAICLRIFTSLEQDYDARRNYEIEQTVPMM